LLLLGLAAAFLIPAAYLGALRLAPKPDDTTLPKPSLFAVAPTSLPSGSPTIGPADAYQQIAVRRVEGNIPGIEVFAVRADGYERVVRFVPDSILGAGQHQFQDWGSASTDGWLALADQVSRWPMVLIDLKDPASEPWIVNEANLGGIGPAWGPGGRVAAQSSSGSMENLVIVDLATRTVSHTALSGSLIGGGPSIIWTADGGILESFGGQSYKTHHLDGSPDTPGLPALYDGRHIFGHSGAQLQICEVGNNDCPISASSGGVRLTTTEGVSQNVYIPVDGGDRVVSAIFGSREGEFWVLTDADAGRQYGVLHVVDGATTDVARFNGGADWGSAFINRATPDGSLLSIFVDRSTTFDFVLAPTDGRAASIHTGSAAGFVAAANLADAGADGYEPPSTTLPLDGQSYQLPSVDDLIAAEKALNPGRVVHGQGSRDGQAGDSAEHDYTFTVAEGGGPFDVYLDCFGPASATVSVHGRSITSPCLRSGTYADSTNVSPGETVTVHTTGETSWRVVVYGLEAAPGDSAAPVPGPG
jgi:hypothetical protein